MYNILEVDERSDSGCNNKSDNSVAMERHSVHMLFFQCFRSLTCSTTAMTLLRNSAFLLVYRCYVFNQEIPRVKMFKEESEENLVAIKLYLQGQLIKVICKKELIASLKKLSVSFRFRIIRYGH